MSAGGPSWTEDRIERLKALWAEGLSASQVAAHLGGVTRNAVIGKVHRLGLSGRPSSGSRAAAAIQPRPSKKLRHTPTKPVSLLPSISRGNLALATSPSLAAEMGAQLAPSADIIPMARYLTLMQLQPNSCRWPIGDPTTPEFRFCGASTEPGQIYCTVCAKKAYQPKEGRPSGRTHSHYSRRFG